MKFKKLNNKLNEFNFKNKALETSYDSIRSFRHDFFNIMQSIDGYIKTGNASCLKKYYDEIKLECDNLNNLSRLNTDFIDDPGVYNLIASKYYKAKDCGVSFNMNFLVKFSSLNLNPYIVTRILGILLDNAIEAAKASKEKFIVLELVPDFSSKTSCIIIQNSYSNKDVDLNKISGKGFTSKHEEKRLSWSWSLDYF